MFKSTRDKPLSAVPKRIILALLISIFSQLLLHRHQVSQPVSRQLLPQAPDTQTLKILSLGEPEVLARILGLWLQSFDNQPGVIIPFKAIDYQKLISWLNAISQLDEHSHYPLFSAAYVYSGVNDEDKQRQIYDFIEQRFKKHPNRYWRWLAHTSIMAKHKLKDNPLALKYAKALRLYATGDNVPHWAQQMEIGILEEKGEYESVRLLIGGLLSENKITDEHELIFLNQRLKELKTK